MILISAGFGQIEAVPFAGILLALYFLNKKRVELTGICLAGAVLIKTWPLMLLPLFIKNSKKIIYYIPVIFIPAIAVLIYCFIFKASIWDVLHPTFSYRGSYGSWGVGVVLSRLLPFQEGIISMILKIITNATILAALLITMKMRIINHTNELFTFFLIISVFLVMGANPAWVLPFIILRKPPFWNIWIIIYSFSFFAPELINAVLNLVLWGLQINMLKHVVRARGFQNGTP